MKGRLAFVLAFAADKQRAHRLIDEAPWNARIEIKEPKRTLPQNDHMWLLLTAVAQQKQWWSMTLTADDWKLIFLDAMKSELRMVPNLNGDGFVNLGRSSSDLGASEMHDFIEFIYAWGAQNGVNFENVSKARKAKVARGAAG